MIKFVEMIRNKCSGTGNHAATEGGCSVVKEQTDVSEKTWTLSKTHKSAPIKKFLFFV